MVGVFREGHTKRPSRRHEPLIIGPPAVSWKRRFAIGLVLVGAATAALLLFSKVAQAHPSPHVQAQVLERPIAGVRNNYWYDYRSDIEEAEIELHKICVVQKRRKMNVRLGPNIIANCAMPGLTIARKWPREAISRGAAA